MVYIADRSQRYLDDSEPLVSGPVLVSKLSSHTALNMQHKVCPTRSRARIADSRSRTPSRAHKACPQQGTFGQRRSFQDQYRGFLVRHQKKFPKCCPSTRLACVHCLELHCPLLAFVCCARIPSTSVHEKYSCSNRQRVTADWRRQYHRVIWSSSNWANQARYSSLEAIGAFEGSLALDAARPTAIRLHLL